jgi:hypothetical protein
LEEFTMSFFSNKRMENKRFGDVVGRVSYLLSDNLDYANAAAAAAAGWVDSIPAPTWHYTTAPAPIDGSSSSSFESDAYNKYSIRSFTGQSDAWAFVICNFSSSTGNPYFIDFLNSSDVAVAQARIVGTTVYAYAGTVNGTGGTVNPGTVYVWVHYTKGTGANALCSVYVSTTSTIPGSPTVTVTTGDATTDAAKVRLGLRGQDGDTLIWNKLRVAAFPIGSNP